MQKLMAACLLLAIIAALQSKAFAAPVNCAFKNSDTTVEGIKSLQMVDNALIVNENLHIPLQHTSIKCGRLGRQHRFDGVGKGLQIILKTCSGEALMEGHIIDAKNLQVAEVICNEAQI